MEKRLLLQVLKLCHEISTTTKVDAFFHYSPHVNTFDVNYHRDGWHVDDDAVYIAQNLEITEENLKSVIDKLRKLKEGGEK